MPAFTSTLNVLVLTASHLPLPLRNSSTIRLSHPGTRSAVLILETSQGWPPAVHVPAFPEGRAVVSFAWPGEVPPETQILQAAPPTRVFPLGPLQGFPTVRRWRGPRTAALRCLPKAGCLACAPNRQSRASLRAHDWSQTSPRRGAKGMRPSSPGPGDRGARTQRPGPPAPLLPRGRGCPGAPACLPPAPAWASSDSRRGDLPARCSTPRAP